MKKFFYILLIFSSLFTSGTFQGLGQTLPMVCSGSVSKYGVYGFNGHSNFVWTITSPSGVVIPYTALDGGADSIAITWNDAYEAGIYTFSVVETSEFGCTGEPWDSQFIILNNNTMSTPFVGVPTSVAACMGNAVTLDPGLFRNYFWTSNLSSDRTFITTQEGTYEVRLVDENQSCSYNEIEAIINPLPNVWLGNDTMLVGDQSLTLDASNPTVLTYQWSTNDNLSSITVYSNPQPQTIWVRVTDYNGCTNADTILIGSVDFSKLRITAAFTPNDDNINDVWDFLQISDKTFKALTPRLDIVDIKVFNRWGKLVWQTYKNLAAGDGWESWDGRDPNGKNLPMDSYHYIIKLTIDGNPYVYKGSVTIVR